MAVRRPKPLIPLRTAVSNVSVSSNTSLFLIPTVVMLARIASARNGEIIASVTTDAKFFVVLAFIGFVCATVNAMRCLPRDEDDVYNQCASGPMPVFVGLMVRFCSRWLTT